MHAQNSRGRPTRKCFYPETLYGLRMSGNVSFTMHSLYVCIIYLLPFTVCSLLELVPYLFSLSGVKVFLTERLCQDPLEKFFGNQRQRGGTHDNPTAQEFYSNTRALRVVNSFCIGSVKGNCRGSREPVNIEEENVPLMKRARASKK